MDGLQYMCFGIHDIGGSRVGVEHLITVCCLLRGPAGQKCLWFTQNLTQLLYVLRAGDALAFAVINHVQDIKYLLCVKEA